MVQNLGYLKETPSQTAGLMSTSASRRISAASRASFRPISAPPWSMKRPSANGSPSAAAWWTARVRPCVTPWWRSGRPTRRGSTTAPSDCGAPRTRTLPAGAAVRAGRGRPLPLRDHQARPRALQGRAQDGAAHHLLDRGAGINIGLHNPHVFSGGDGGQCRRPPARPRRASRTGGDADRRRCGPGLCVRHPSPGREGKRSFSIYEEKRAAPPPASASAAPRSVVDRSGTT